MFNKIEPIGQGIQYPEEIEENGKIYGYKAANLIYLNKLVKEIQTSLDLKVVIPTFAPIPHQLIEEHLDKYSNKDYGWRTIFKEFKDSYELQDDKKTLEPNTVVILQNLQKYIVNYFIEHPLELSELPTELQSSELFMVRSTGVNEDKVDMANPGGNESVPSDAVGISKALGKVVASYISEKSLLQRLKAGDKHIFDMPVMPALIQTLVGEGLNQPHNDSEQKIVSGVIYTNSGAMRIQSAPGHGEYVVNSKGLTDNYYISNEGIIYSEIRPKSHRLVPTLNSVENEIKLSWNPNEAKDAYSSSLPTEVLHAIKKVASQIEASYKMRMDIEFVYDVQKNILNIVQARPIPAGNRKYLEPSAVSPKYLGNPKQTLATIEGIQVVTPEVNAAAVITDPSQVIICKDIKEALDEFLKPINAARDIRAIIVQNYTPDNSHEAGQFNLNALPVMQVADVTIVEKLLQQGDSLLIVDPQHSKIYQMDPGLKKGESNPDRVENNLYEAQILEKGIFASTLSAYVSPQEFNFNHGSIEKEKMSVGPTEKAIDLLKAEGKKLGDLVVLAEVGDEFSLNLLLSIAYEAMSYRSKEKQETNTAQTHTPSQKLKYNFEQLENPGLGEANEHCKAALAQILTLLSNLRKKGFITAKVYKQSMIAGSEIAVLLNRMEDLELKQQDKNLHDAFYLEYFNIKRKFEGCITGIGNKNVLIQSVQTDLFNLKHQKKIEEIARKNSVNLDKFSKQQKTILYEVSKLSSSSSNSNLNENWQKFCLDVCESEPGANLLADMVINLVKLDIHENWLNLFFVRAFKVHHGESSKVLMALNKDLSQLDFQSVKESQRIIAELEAQIPRWADKTKFDRLYKELEGNLSLLDELLKYKDTGSNIGKFVIIQSTRKFIDAMDRTIKSLDYSLEYENTEFDNELRAQRFRKLIVTFHDSLAPWLLIAYPHETKQITNFHKSLNQAIERSAKNDKEKISQSLKFDVRQTLVIDTKEGKGRWGANLDECKTLEECFSCIHQNYNLALDKIEKQQDLIMGREFYPPVFAQFEEELMKRKGKEMGNRGTPISNPNNHLNDLIPHIFYSIPLSIHNAMITVFKKPDSDEFCLQFTTGSPFSEEMHRWRIISAKSYFDLAAFGIQLTSGFQFKHQTSYQYSSEFCVSLSKENIPILLKIIELAIAGTYQSSYSKHSSDDEARFLMIEQTDDMTLKYERNAILSLIQNGYFIKTHFFENNTEDRMKVLHKLIKNPESNDLFSFEELSVDVKIQNYKYRNISDLLNNSARSGNEHFFFNLFTNADFDDIFCTELTGYIKIEFTKKYFLNAGYNQKAIINALLIAVSKDSHMGVEIVNLLTQLGADINQADPDGMTTLMYAVLSGKHIDNIKALLAAGANLSLKNNEGKTVFDLTEKPEILVLLKTDKAVTSQEVLPVESERNMNSHAFFSDKSNNENKSDLPENQPGVQQEKKGYS